MFEVLNSQKKSISEKRIEFSFILYKIESSMMKTHDDKSMKLDWATGENIIDKKKQIRGFYDGTDPKAIKKLLEDIKVLKASYNN